MGNQVANAAAIADEGQYGPAMAALSERQRAFVLALVENGGDHTAAARTAGYLDKGTGAIRVQAHRLAHDDRVQSALVEVARKRVKAATIIAADFLLECMRNPALETKERIKAAQLLMDRGGLHALTEHKIDVTHKQDTDSQILEVYQGAMRLGIDPRTLLGNLVDRVNKDMGTIEVVPKEDDGQADPAQEDVTDLI